MNIIDYCEKNNILWRPIKIEVSTAGKKKPKPLYGKLKLYKAKLKEGENGKFIEAEIITDQRKNKNFWREGMKITRKRKK